MRPAFGWVLLTLAAALVALGIWDIRPPDGPPGPDDQHLLTTTPGWYLQAGYLVVALVLTAGGAWVLLRGPRQGGDS
jgi:hypothetical protein